MKCPICGNELICKKQAVSVDANGESVFNEFAICHTCKKKWNLDKQRAKKAAEIKEAKPKEVKPTEAKPNSEGIDPIKVKSASAGTAKPRAKRPAESAKKEAVGQTTTFSNIPPLEVREKREREVKANYENMLSQGEVRKGGQKKKPVKRSAPPQIEKDDDLYADEPVHKKKFSVLKLFLILLAIAIIAVAGFLGWKVYQQKGFSNLFANAQNSDAVTASAAVSDTSADTEVLAFSDGVSDYTVSL